MRCHSHLDEVLQDATSDPSRGPIAGICVLCATTDAGGARFGVISNSLWQLLRWESMRPPHSPG
jgi:hypothetical protein